MYVNYFFLFQEEIEILKTEMENVVLEQKQAKEEANIAIKESVQTKLESDGKVKVCKSVCLFFWFWYLLMTFCFC